MVPLLFQFCVKLRDLSKFFGSGVCLYSVGAEGYDNNISLDIPLIANYSVETWGVLVKRLSSVF